MSLINRIFGKDGAAASATTQFGEGDPESTDQKGSRNAPRRELVQVILRDTMRKHGIPSDWIECRMLSTVSRGGRHGLHVNFVVKQAHDRLLAYVFAFQDSFERELTRFEPRARDWLLSLAWEFQGFNAKDMPDPHTWAASLPAPLLPAGGPAPRASAPTAQEAQASQPDDDLASDLQALFAIRDAAIAQPVPHKAGAPEDDFQDTQAGDDSPQSVKK
jgi:hypothetical protein